MLYIIPSEKTRFSHPKAYIHVNVSTFASTYTFELHHEKTCLLHLRKERRKSAFYMYILFNIFLVVFTCKITSNQKIIISWGLNLFFPNKIHTYWKYLKALRSVVICAFFYIINFITV